MLLSKTLHEFCESSLKSQNIEKTIEHEMSMSVVNLPTESVTYQEDILEEEVAEYEVGVKKDMVEKLNKAVRIMEQEI